MGVESDTRYMALKILTFDGHRVKYNLILQRNQHFFFAFISILSQFLTTVYEMTKSVPWSYHFDNAVSN